VVKRIVNIIQRTLLPLHKFLTYANMHTFIFILERSLSDVFLYLVICKKRSFIGEKK